MYRAIFFTTLFKGCYYIATVLSILHTWINIEITNIPDIYDNIIDSASLYFLKELLVTSLRQNLKSLPFNFIFITYLVIRFTTLLFGFENLYSLNGLVERKLGFITEFIFSNWKLINGNYILGYYITRIFIS